MVNYNAILISRKWIRYNKDRYEYIWDSNITINNKDNKAADLINNK